MTNTKWDSLVYMAQRGNLGNVVRNGGRKYSQQQIARPVSEVRMAEFLSIKDDMKPQGKRKAILTFLIGCVVLYIYHGVKVVLL